MLKNILIFGTILFSISLKAQTTQQISEHGYRYFHHINNGGQKAQRGESIKAYVNVFIGDTVLSSSRKNLGGTYKYDIPPAAASISHFPPIYDAALLMGIGDSMTIYQTVDSTMRSFLPKGTERETELRFEIALVKIVSLEEKAEEDADAAARAEGQKILGQRMVEKYKAGELNDNLAITHTGLKVLLLEMGKGPRVKENEPIQVHYYGFLIDGTSFDNSFDRRHPLAFPAGVGQMIPGFDEGVMMLNHGSKAYFFIPSNLAYGDQEAAGGLIPPNSELIFYIELF
ncbi:MAG: FKBP-type peptidyl-prolyl cis-trans isomerase [Saprospiraceae bacterium]|nr:FKBP-type peptidyl-prolyl cis-trans isomerase [Saprospiraceae bacterium]MCB9342399.1 FKBP-type peptidyl-prolyl cis-trans isomerase [Lewinellaceae bacterium]